MQEDLTPGTYFKEWKYLLRRLSQHKSSSVAKSMQKSMDLRQANFLRKAFCLLMFRAHTSQKSVTRLYKRNPLQSSFQDTWVY